MANINLPVQAFTTEKRRPGSGAEQWGNGSQAVYENSPMDVYKRLNWTEIEGATLGSYDWTVFDSWVNGCITKKQKFNFGIMTCHPWGDTGTGCIAIPGGGYAAYPLYLHTLMMAEAVKAWRTGDTWTPNYNSTHYLTRLLALYQAIDAHVKATSYNGVSYSKVVNIIDVRGFGAWGEWNSSYTPTNTVKDYPAGTFPTIDTFKKIIDIHVQGFPDNPLVNMIAVFDGNYLQNTMIPPEIGEYALAVKNNFGPLGWRRDQWGALDNYLKDYLENNSRVDKNKIMSRWVTSPITGEPMPSGNAMDDLLRQINLYHATSFGDGNYGNVADQARLANNVKAASNAAGFKLALMSGTYTSTNSALSVTLNWRNGGIGNCYENYDVIIFLKNGQGQNVAQVVSKFKPKLFQPSSLNTAFTDSLAFNLAVGSYTLAVKITDGYRDPLPLYNTGRQSDGSYHLGSITVAAPPTPNQPPVVNAGNNQIITLPTSSVNLSGSATDADGTVNTVTWSQVEGPATGLIANAATLSTAVTGLSAAGVYRFKLTATDNSAASVSDEIIVTVNEAPPDPEKTLVDVSVRVRVYTTKFYSDGSQETIES